LKNVWRCFDTSMRLFNKTSKIHTLSKRDLQNILLFEKKYFFFNSSRIGLTTKQKRGDKKDKNVTPYYLELSEKENSNILMNVVRPPELWNYPEILKEHKFRSIANPNKCYDDHRVDGLQKKILEISEKLINFRMFTWAELVSRVIDVYSNEENYIPTSID